MTKSYYIASRLENVDQVRAVKARLDAAGWTHTYDWTVHGSVQTEGVERIGLVAAAEAEGVWMADVVIVLLSGGRGTHVELGIAIGMVDPVVFGPGEDKMRICIYSPDPDTDFNTKNGKTCAFYYHPAVERFTGDLDGVIDTILGVS